MVMIDKKITYRDMNGIAIKAKDVYFKDGFENLEDVFSRFHQIKYPLHKYFISESYKFSGDDVSYPTAGYACVIQEPYDYELVSDTISGLELSLSTLFQVYLDSDSKSDIPIYTISIGIPAKLINLLPSELRTIKIINYHTLFKYVRDTVLSTKKDFTLKVFITVIEEEIENIDLIKSPYDTLQEADPSEPFLGYEHEYRGFKNNGPSSKPGIRDCFAYSNLLNSYNLITIAGKYETSGTCTLYGRFDPPKHFFYGRLYSAYKIISFKADISLSFGPPLYDEIKDNGHGELRNKYAEDPFQDYAIYNFDSESDYLPVEQDYGPSQFDLKCNCPISRLGFVDNSFLNLDYYDTQISDYSKRKKSMTIRTYSDECDSFLGKKILEKIT